MQELGEHLGRLAVSLYYHLRKLEEVGLVQEDGVRETDRGTETLSVGPKELEDAYRSLSASLKEQDVELVTIGCPHVSIDELEEIAQFLKGKEKRANAPDLWVCTSREVKKLGTEAIKVIEDFGKVLVDTCMVVAPIDEVASHTATNSGKAATYLPLESFCGQKVLYRSTPMLLSLLVE